MEPPGQDFRESSREHSLRIWIAIERELHGGKIKEGVDWVVVQYGHHPPVTILVGGE